MTLHNMRVNDSLSQNSGRALFRYFWLLVKMDDNRLIRDLYSQPLSPTYTEPNAWKYVIFRVFSNNNDDKDKEESYDEISHELFLNEVDRKDKFFSSNTDWKLATDKYSIEDWLGILSNVDQVNKDNFKKIQEIPQFTDSKRHAEEVGVDTQPFEDLFQNTKDDDPINLAHLCILLTSKLPFQVEDSKESWVTFWPEVSRCESDLRNYSQLMSEEKDYSPILDKKILYHILKN